MATINYKGMELEEVTEPQIFDPPKKCVVWDNELSPFEEYVLAITVEKRNPVLTYQHTFRQHCALLPDPPKPRRATIKELAKWCAQGNGQIQDTSRLNCVFTGLDYGPDCDDDVAPEIYKVRKWSDTEWHEPTVEYMGLELPGRNDGL